MKPLFSLLSLAVLLFASCKKNESGYQQPDIAITMTSPTEGQVFSAGDTLNLAATVSSPVDLHGYSWSLTRQNDNTNTALAGTEEHAHGRNFSVSGKWPIPASLSGTYIVRLTVEIDHDGHEASKAVAVKVQP